MEKQEAIERLKEFCKLRAFCELYPDACRKDKCEIYMAIEALSELPRVGKWVYEERKRLDDETDDGSVYVTEKWWKCSKCGFDMGFLESEPTDKCCPQCGDKKALQHGCEKVAESCNRIGDEVYVHGYIDEVRNDTVIIRNEGGYFGTSPDEVFSCSEKSNRSELKIAESGSVDSEQPEIKSDRTTGGMIYRQDAIDELDKGAWGVEWDKTLAKAMIESLPSAQPDNQINLCDSCDYSYPDCPSKNDDVIFGNAIGNDNICACNKYNLPAQPYTEGEIQAMQDLEQAQLDTVYDLGWKEGREALEKEVWEDERERLD